MASTTDVIAESNQVAAIPEPPYDESTNVGDGICCYFPGCQHSSRSYLEMMKHLKTAHKVNPADVKDTYMFKQAHPKPDYDESTDTKEGIPCYYPCCGSVCKSYGKLLSHVRMQHGLPYSMLKGTHLYEEGTKEVNHAQKKNYDSNKRKKSESS